MNHKTHFQIDLWFGSFHKGCHKVSFTSDLCL